MMTKRQKAIENLTPTAQRVLLVFEDNPTATFTANQIAAKAGIRLGTATPRLAELDERGYGFIRECPPVPGDFRVQKAWRYRGDRAVLFNVNRHGRVKEHLSYYALWMRERGARERLVAKVKPVK